MFLASSITDFIPLAFGYVLELLYQLTTNYGVALILFAIIVRLILLPVNAKSRKSMMKMSRLQPKIQEIQKKYENDKQKQNEAIQQLQKEEGATMGCGGCLWSLVPLLILLPMFNVIRYPIQYVLHETKDVADVIVNTIKTLNPDIFTSNDLYGELVAISKDTIPQYAEAIKAAIAEANLTLNNPATMEGLDFNFLGINLGLQPQYNIFGADWAWDWNHIGGFLMPVLSAGSQVLTMWVSQRSNDSLITNKEGIQDKETAKNSQAAQQNKMMMWMMPIMSLIFGFTYPVALSLYWMVGGLASMLENQVLTKHYRKVYDAEDAQRREKARELEAIEAEKERVRAERRAANPEGITANTSKKKLQQKQREEQEAEKAAAVKEYNARKGIVEENDEKATLSGVADRPYCKGRAYDPNRFDSTEE